MAEDTNPEGSPSEPQSKMAEDHKHKGSGVHFCYAPRDPRRALFGCIAIFLLGAGITALTVWLVYRPQKPRFAIVGVAVFNLNNTSPPPFLSTTMQFSIITTNPNKRVSIFYDHLSVSVLYHNQMITKPVTMPPLFQEQHSTIQLAPILGGGGAVPVSPEVCYGLGMEEEAYGTVGLRLVVLGKLRWKAGAITTGHYGIYVTCDVLLRLSKGFGGQVPFIASPVCEVDV